MDKRFYLIEEDPVRKQKWAYLTEGLKDDQRLQCEVLLNNMSRWISEASTSMNIGTFTTYAFPLIRRIFPKMISQSLCSVQPMSQPTGKIFFLDFKYGTTGGGTTEGDRLDQLPNKDYATSEESGTVKEVNFDISSVDVSCEEKKLKAIWTIEAQQDLRAYHGLDAENEVMAVCGDEITREVDMIIINDMLLSATAGNVNWDVNVPTSAPWNVLAPKAYKETLYEAITDANNMIFKKRYRNATWIVADSDTCARLEKLENFKLSETVDDAIFNVGIHLFGVLRNRYVVYKHPWFVANKMLIGYKGASWLDTGYVYCPYIPLYVTPLIVDPNDFKPRRGLMSRYAKKAVIGDAFATITLVSS